MSDNTADEARRGLGASLAGKAKEVAGAVLGNDSLAAEGQLQQAEAAARKEASAKDAIAQAQAREAAEKLTREQEIAQRERAAAEQVVDLREERVLREAEIDLTTVEAQAEQEKRAEQARVDAEKRAELQAAAVRTGHELSEANKTERTAESSYLDDQAAADAAEQAAARARADAERLESQTS